MAHLFHTRDGGRSWEVIPLHDFSVTSLSPPPGGAVSRNEMQGLNNIELQSLHIDNRHCWVVFTDGKTGLRINGSAVFLGMKVINHRDLLMVPGEGIWLFSTEEHPQLMKFSGSDREKLCPRCRSAIQPGDDAVRCPKCHVWHHQTPELNCWTYSERCQQCDQITRFDKEYEFTPEGL